jgi:eukaryotic-like serine/threonine-protein kinase
MALAMRLAVRQPLNAILTILGAPGARKGESGGRRGGHGIIRLTMPLLPGAKLEGYEVLGLLGAGGMGEVYRARDRVLKREVAIKVLPSFFSQNPDRLRRFEQEAQAAAALNHPNILAVYQFGVFDGAPYLVSELLVGETLRQQLKGGLLPIRKAIDTGVQIAHGIAAAHEKGIVHRDLKPENLFVTKDGRVKILDFGLAKLTQPQAESDAPGPTMTHATEPGVVMGTAGYMSPEHVRGKMVDHRADIFAFGAILYEMLAGKRAFQRSTSADTMAAILNEDPPGISQVVQSTPPGLQRVVHRCLEKNPEQRFQSASDLAFALEALSESGISSGVATGAPKPRWSRNALVWLAGLTAVFAVAVVAYFVISRQNRVSPLRISEYTQLTHDGHAGHVIGTDGSRLYLNRGVGQPIGQVAISGGDIEPVQVPVPSPFLLGVSPDGSTLLVESYAKGLLPAQPLYAVQILGGAQRYLADALDAVWSPDGKSVAYSTPDNNINLIQSDSTGAHKLTSAGSPVYSLNWSPDGKTIQFDRGGSIWEMSSIGTNIHDLFPGWRPSSRKCCGIWSPDGKFLVFLSGPGSQLWARDESHRPFRQPSSEPVQLTSGPIRWGAPIFSGDGKKMFASGSTSRGELVRLDPKSNQLQPFLGGISADFVVFSKDGRSVAYVSYPEGILWKANRDGTDRVQLSEPSMYPRLPRWSPNGAQLLFMASPEGLLKAYIVSAEGGNPQSLLPGDREPEDDPNWSPDGRKIAFSNSQEAGRDRNSTIRILNLDSHQVTTLPGSAGMYSQRWSPDGRFLVAQSWDSSSLHLFDIKAQRWSLLYEGELAFPLWSSDSRFIYFLKYRKDPGVYRLRVAGGEAELIKDLKDVHTTGYYSLWLGLDPADAPLLLRDIGTTDVYALTIEQK